MSTGTTPSAGPSTAPASPDIVFDDVKNQTTRELQKLKDALKVNDADPNHSAEWEKIKKEFEAKKDTITKISAAELAELKREIEDPNNILAGNLNVVDGGLIYNADIADETPTTPEKVPETPTPEETIDLVEQMGQGPLQQVPESYQKEVKNHIVNNGGFAGIVMKGLSNWVVEIIKGIKGFFATFGMEDEGEKKDALAQINGFEDAEEERRVTASVKMLKSSPVTKGPPLSDILRISHISNEELTQILKDNPGLDFSSTKNIEAAFTGKYKHSGDREPMKRYERIFINLTDIHNNLDPSEPYNAVNKFKEILAGSQNAELDIRIPATVPSDSVEGNTGTPTETGATGPASPEITPSEAESADQSLKETKEKLNSITEEGAEKQEALDAVKKAQERVDTIKSDIKKKIEEKILENTNGIKRAEHLERTKQIQIDAATKAGNEEELKELKNEMEQIKKDRAGIEKLNKELSLIIIEITDTSSAYNATLTFIKVIELYTQGNEAIDREVSEEEKKKILEKISILCQTLSSDRIVDPSKITEAQNLFNQYKDKPDYKVDTSILDERIEIAKAKIDLIAITIGKKKDMAAANRFINWGNDDDDIYGGWAEIDGSEHADGSWIELDADGFGEFDWQLIRGDNPLVKKLGGLKRCREILIANKDVIKEASDIEKIKYN